MNCGEQNKEYVIRVENNTAEAITLLSFSNGKIKNEAPVLVQSHSRTKLYSDVITSGIDIGFSYNEKMYEVNTGYADDYISYTIRFTESATSIHGIECFFIVKGIYGTDTSTREITERE
jgi:hypothetical protein